MHLQLSQVFTADADPAAAFLKQYYAIMEFDAYGILPHVGIATLIQHGKMGTLLPVENAIIMAQHMPKAKLVIFENSAYALAKEMNKVLSAILNFLRENG
jgi:pimeloyl-ACP methyl ester carboxylesterase